jgi:hypothetical protein
MAIETHPDRMARLHADVELECAKRWAKMTGGTLTKEGRVPDDERITYDLEAERERYKASRKIEDEACKRWRAFARAVVGLEHFAVRYEAGAGAQVAEAIVTVLPSLQKAVHAPYDVASAGAAASAGRPPNRVTFVAEKLEPLATTLSAEDPCTLDLRLLAVLTLLAGFWPYTTAAERRFAKSGGYPSPARVISKESERLRSLLRR